MSYSVYLRNKAASKPIKIDTQRPSDASLHIQKKRFQANQTFFADGKGFGSLAMDTSRPAGTPLLQHAASSYQKATTRPAAASDYTAYRGGQGVDKDTRYLVGSPIVNRSCCQVDESPETVKYASASDYLRSKGCELSSHQPHIAVELGGPLFVDNTIRLSAMNTRMVGDGCVNAPLVAANHTHSPGLPVCPQNFAVTQHSFMAAPPGFQNKGVGGARIGAYYTPKSGYVENKHGNDLGVNPRRTPGPWVYTPGAPAHLKINRPTLFRIKPF